jgi:hypothetical protein
MRGFIDTRQVLFHFGTICREFGPRCATRCLCAILRGRQTTFLELAFQPAHPRAPLPPREAKRVRALLATRSP